MKSGRFGLDDQAIRKIKAALSSIPEIREIIVFGSRAKGTHRAGSDIDLVFKGSLDLQTLNRARDALHDLDLPYTFDILSFDRIESADLLDHIQRVGKPLA